MSITIHITRDGESLGKFDPVQVRDGYQDGTFLETDMAWMEGLPEWLTVGEFIHEIFQESDGVSSPELIILDNPSEPDQQTPVEISDSEQEEVVLVEETSDPGQEELSEEVTSVTLQKEVFAKTVVMEIPEEKSEPFLPVSVPKPASSTTHIVPQMPKADGESFKQPEEKKKVALWISLVIVSFVIVIGVIVWITVF